MPLRIDLTELPGRRFYMLDGELYEIEDYVLKPSVLLRKLGNGSTLRTVEFGSDDARNATELALVPTQDGVVAAAEYGPQAPAPATVNERRRGPPTLREMADLIGRMPPAPPRLAKPVASAGGAAPSGPAKEKRQANG